MKVVITPDDKYIRQINYAALVYDGESKGLLAAIHQNSEMTSDCTIDRPSFRPFGLVESGNTIYIASNDRIGMFDSKTFQFKGLVPHRALPNTHQLAVYEDNLLVCNTANNTISFINGDSHKYFNILTGEFESRVEVESSESHDTAHINSLLVDGDTLYVCCHNLGRENSEVLSVDLKTMKVKSLFRAGMCNHGVAFLDGVIYSLSTAGSCMIAFDIESKTVSEVNLPSNKDIHFLRGLRVYEGELYFGRSNRFSPNPIASQCSLFKFDPRSGLSKHFMTIGDALTIADFDIIG